MTGEKTVTHAIWARSVGIIAICQKLGFRLAYRNGDPVIQTEIDL
jgi:hypothetical protein